MLNGLRSLAKELRASFLHVSREVNEEAAELGKSGTAREALIIANGFLDLT